ncbi:citramalyl-CoA lyase, mitochondrial isoform X10 [Macaca fascicularis]
MLPKVESPEEIQWFADKFSFHLKGRKLEQPMNLIPFVETAMGLLNFKAVCEETLKIGPQVGLFLDAVVFGGEDFRASIGATSSKETLDILYARQKIVVIAKAFGLQAIDLVYIDFRDGAGLLRQSREGAAMGFTGKQVIHPNQIAVVQEQFSPSPEKIKWAEELIAAFKEHQQLGKGFTKEILLGPDGLLEGSLRERRRSFSSQKYCFRLFKCQKSHCHSFTQIE